MEQRFQGILNTQMTFLGKAITGKTYSFHPSLRWLDFSQQRDT